MTHVAYGQAPEPHVLMPRNDGESESQNCSCALRSNCGVPNNALLDVMSWGGVGGCNATL